MDDAKELVKAFFEPVLKMAVKNSKDEDEKKEEVKNEDVDKRKLIDEIGGILKDKVDDEIIRTVIKKCEEIGYDKSEAGTADNKKAKNEDDEEKEEKEEKFEEEKEIADNEDDKKDDKKDDKEDDKDKEEEAENKCKNSMDDVKKAIMGAKSQEIQSRYLSKAQRLELGNKY